MGPQYPLPTQDAAAATAPAAAATAPASEAADPFLASISEAVTGGAGAAGDGAAVPQPDPKLEPRTEQDGGAAPGAQGSSGATAGEPPGGATAGPGGVPARGLAGARGRAGRGRALNPAEGFASPAPGTMPGDAEERPPGRVPPGLKRQRSRR